MSRSKKKTPITGITTAISEKQDKLKANRKFRRRVKQQVTGQQEIHSEVREVSDVWAFEKDGKKYMKKPTDKDFRK